MKREEKKILDNPTDQKTVLLHTCCAPCSSAIIECLLKNDIRPIIYYCNPNIYPYEEYLIRKNECTRYCNSLGLEIVDADYNHEYWLEYIKGMENEPERGGRCFKCFSLRLEQSARYAQKRGIKLITTTLASSRWKNLEQINEAGKAACLKVSSEGEYEVLWWEQNWRKGGLQERRNQIIKEMGFYNQLYCGCEFSRK